MQLCCAVLCCAVMCQAVLGWAGLGWAGLGWAGLCAATSARAVAAENNGAASLARLLPTLPLLRRLSTAPCHSRDNGAQVSPWAAVATVLSGSRRGSHDAVVLFPIDRSASRVRRE
jgi:hypothetical protein